MAHARLCQVEQHVIDVQQCKASQCSSSLVSCEETEKSSTTKALPSCLQTSPKPSLILTVCKNGKEYSTRKRENKSTKRPSNRLEETQKTKRRHLDDFPLVLTPVCSSFNLQPQDSIYSPIIITPCTSNFNDTSLTTEITGMPITPKSSSEIGASCDEFSQSDSEEPSSVATVDSRTQTTRQRSNSNIVQNSSEVSTPVIPLTSSTITPYSSTTTCSITSQFDSLSSPSSTPSSSCHPSANYTDDDINKFFDSWMDCYELKKKQFINSRNKL